VTDRPRVEILYFEGCPHWEAAQALVEDVVDRLAVDADIRLVAVADPQDAASKRFLGSPTVRVDGRDVEPGADTRADFSYACRGYRSDGGLSGLPERRFIVAALAEATHAH
jgi:hypothetical protein